MAQDTATDARTASDRFPSTGVSIEEGDFVWIDAGIVRGHADVGASASQGCDVVDVDGDELTVEYGSRDDVATISREHVRETDLEEGEQVTYTYDSSYTADDAPRTEKTGEVVAVKRTRRGGFDGLTVDVDGDLYRIGTTGVVSTTGSTHGSTHRRIGDDAVVERTEEKIVVGDFDELDALSAIVAWHARKSRQAGFEDHADECFEIASDAISELGDRFTADSLRYVFEGDDTLECLYTALEYCVEQQPVDELAETDVDVARKYYRALGGGYTADDLEGDGDDDRDDDGDGWDPEPAQLRDGETPDETSHAARNAAQLAMYEDDVEEIRAERDDEPQGATDEDVADAVAELERTATVSEHDDGGILISDGSGFASDHPDATYCADCGRYRVDCVHSGAPDDDGGERTCTVCGDPLGDRVGETCSTRCALELRRGDDVATDGAGDEWSVPDGDDSDDDADVISVGDRVLVASHGPEVVETKRTGEVIEIRSASFDDATLEYVVDLDGSGQAHVTSDALIPVAEIPFGGVLMSTDDAAVAFDAIDVVRDLLRSDVLGVDGFGHDLPDVVATSRTLGTQLALADPDAGRTPDRDQVLVDRDDLEEAVETLKGKLEGDVQKWGRDETGYDVDAFAELVERLHAATQR